MIDITLIGTAALSPLPGRALTAVQLSLNGHTILFDAGEGTQSAARGAGISLIKTDLIALTHYHGDHIFGMPGLLQTMCSMGRTETLYITGPEGLKEALAPILELAGWTSYEIVLMEMPKEGLALSTLVKGWPEGAVLTAFSTEHRVPSQGYQFNLNRAPKFMPKKAKELGVPTNMWGLLQKGQSVTVGERTVTPDEVMGEARKGLKFVYSGDTCACDSLISAAEGADLLILEATYGEDEQAQLAAGHGHMNFRQAAETAKKANAKELWLAHYSQMIENPDAYLKNASEVFENTVCGKDGMKTTLQFEKE